MLMPLFNVYDVPEHWTLYRALRDLGPARAWEVMSELNAADQLQYRATPEIAASEAQIRDNTLRFLRMCPTLEGRNLEAMAEQFATYGPRLQLHTTFNLMWLDNPNRLFGEVVDFRGREYLEGAVRRGRGVLALPLHLGPSYAIGPMLAHVHQTKIVFNRINFDSCKELAFPDLPAEAFAMDATSPLRAGLRALSEGKIFSMFPELDPRGVDNHHQRVDFLGTSVVVPTGPVIMSRMSGAPMVVITLRDLGGGRYRLECSEPIHPPASKDEIPETVDILWRSIDREIATGETADWEMWFEFDRMLPGGVGAPKTSAALSVAGS